MPARDPSRIVDALCAYWDTDALVAAIDLGVFTALDRRARTAAELAHVCRADRARLGRLCNALVPLGLLRVQGGRYRSTVDAATLLGARRFFSAPAVRAGFRGLADIVRRQNLEDGALSGGKLWREFADAVAGVRRPLTSAIANELERGRLIRGRILDVGSGASPLGIELLKRRGTAGLVAQDRRGVVQVALARAAAAGVAKRTTAIAGDARTVAWGGPYDLILMINVLDYFDASTRARLVRKARVALKPGGSLAVYAPLLDESRGSPPEATAYDLLLLALGAPGGASTYGELRALLRAAGFAAVSRSAELPLVLARRAR
jgi:SAM-dependent methyltransferase